MHAEPTPPKDDSVFLSADDLRKGGVDLSCVVFGLISNDGNLVVANNKETSAKKVAAGVNNWLHLLHVDWQARKIRIDKVSFPFAMLDQYALTPDGRSIVVIAQDGTQVWLVDVATRTTRALFKHEAGKPGFQIMPAVFWVENDKLHTRGYFYDKDRAQVAEAAVSIDPSKTGINIFTQVHDYGPITRRLYNHCISILYSSVQAYYTVFEKKDEQSLYAYSGDDTRLDLIDRGMRFLNLAVGRDRVLYSIRRTGAKNANAVVYDVGTKKRWNLGDPQVDYVYPYMSEKGDAVLVSNINFSRRKMTTWIGHEATDFRLRPVPGMSDVFPGTIRMAKNGSTMSFFDNTGLTVRRLPQP